ncbi:MAG TPA: signal peptidase I [Verrucomicrobiae bacterium]|nr:signal peptidase I [Verrucomicrobiae bacterium]
MLFETIQPATPIQTPAHSSNPHSWLRIILIGRNLKRTLFRAAIWAAVCFVIFKVALVRVEVIGISMLPTCPEYSRYWVNRCAYLWHEPRRGDIVAIRLAGPHEMLLKRIIGLPGETVAFSDGQVLINGVVLNEPYEKFPCNWDQPPVLLTNGEYYVCGDNRTMPAVDHEHGICQRYRIVGKIFK